MNIKHKISGNNFHGNFSIVFIGPVNGFELSEKQQSQYAKKLCPSRDCTCGGGYGTGYDSGSARVVSGKLIPALKSAPVAALYQRSEVNRDPYEENRIQATYGEKHLVNSVNALIADGWSTADAVDGICEGHELGSIEESFLRIRFSVEK